MRSLSSVLVALTASALVAFSAPTATAATTGARPHSGAQVAAGSRLLGTCEIGGHICGEVHNRDDRHRLLITDQWGRQHDSSTWRVLKTGQDGPDVGVKDVDGYWVAPGCKVRPSGEAPVGPGWHKVTNIQNIQIVDIAC
ncbi:hypothetical protein [Streptomyces marispadix]|uniref:Secreted protein n=1 Tax=Streptomyces marispadix TaxID=2922868 RepID=A0ABS9T488_9ACTN|nr:hypothetical protein [Streptomyces marispadix]MCH6163273.1 hypothetical protein [Streptomyces marispadix]